MSKHDVRPTMPWWRVRMVWLVIGGPAVVVVASFVTLVIAVAGADVPISDTAPAPQAHAHTPATQARNHVVAAHR